MKKQHLVILIAVVMALIFAAPVSAYSISVTGRNSDGYTSSRFQSYLDAIQVTKPQSSSTIGASVISGANSNGSIGSVSAYSNGVYQNSATFVEFKQSVSVDGVIQRFSFNGNFDSGAFR